MRTMLVRTAIDAERRAWNREHVVERLPEAAIPTSTEPEDRAELAAGLAASPPRQRATVVLRFWLDLSVEDTAAELGISTGPVKSHTTKALASLRDHLGADAPTA